MLADILSYSEFVEATGHEPELVPVMKLAEIYMKHPMKLEKPTAEELLEQARFVEGGVVVDMPLRGTGSPFCRKSNRPT